nr:acyl-CoA thioesterase [Caulobacter ginsengisoli]
MFTQSFTPVDADIDVNGHVNNVVYLRWMQDIAISHWVSRAPAEEQAKWAWVALRHEIDYRRALLPGEEALARTWVGTRRGPRFDRFVRIDGPDGEMCSQTRSEWVLIDAVTRRPARVPDWMETMFA